VPDNIRHGCGAFGAPLPVGPTAGVTASRRRPSQKPALPPCRQQKEIAPLHAHGYSLSWFRRYLSNNATAAAGAREAGAAMSASAHR